MKQELTLSGAQTACALFLFSLSFVAAAQGQRFQVTPNPISFGDVTVGTSQTVSATVTNVTTSTLKIYSAVTSNQEFSYSGLTLPLTLAPGQAVQFQVSFSPTGVGTLSGTLSFFNRRGRIIDSAQLSGAGVNSAPPPDTTAPTVDITSPAPGATVSAAVTLAANASDNVGVAAVQFYINTTVIGNEITAPPFTLSWDSTTVVNGSYSVTAVARDAAGNRTTSAAVPFTVNNATAAPHRASLSWNASPSQVVGYYVYRASQTGGPYTRVNSSPTANTTFDDTTVVGGMTYYYVITAVSNQVESTYSNEAVASIPQ